jgi:hypothetical protein
MSKKTKNCRDSVFSEVRTLMRGLLRPISVIFLCASLVLQACGGSPKQEHSSAVQVRTPEQIPTPDTTPIEALRTPAGLTLKTGPEPATTPAAPPAAKPTP